MANSPPRPTEKEYGRRLYVSDLTYQGQIRKPTDKALDDMYKLPHSENKKPYMEDSYEEMEYFQSPPFGFPWDFPEFDFPFIPPSEPWAPPWLLVFWCQVASGSCYCENQEKCFAINCSHQIVGVEINEFLSFAGAKGKFDISHNGGQICITAGDTDEAPVVYFDVTMVADPGDGSQVYGEHVGLSVLLCYDDEDCVSCEGPFLTVSFTDLLWRSGSTTVTFTGGTPPFTYSIEGTDVSWDNATTTARSNDISVGASACGCVVIEITDACGQSLQADVGIPECSARVSEASSWNAYHDIETITFCDKSTTWGKTNSNQSCDNPCHKHENVRGGPWWDCSCRCTNYLMTHSDTDTGCWFNCMVQVDARALKYCTIKVSDWGCT